MNITEEFQSRLGFLSRRHRTQVMEVFRATLKVRGVHWKEAKPDVEKLPEPERQRLLNGEWKTEFPPVTPPLLPHQRN